MVYVLQLPTFQHSERIPDPSGIPVIKWLRNEKISPLPHHKQPKIQEISLCRTIYRSHIPLKQSLFKCLRSICRAERADLNSVTLQIKENELKLADQREIFLLGSTTEISHYLCLNAILKLSPRNCKSITRKSIIVTSNQNHSTKNIRPIKSHKFRTRAGYSKNHWWCAVGLFRVHLFCVTIHLWK